MDPLRLLQEEMRSAAAAGQVRYAQPPKCVLKSTPPACSPPGSAGVLHDKSDHLLGGGVVRGGVLGSDKVDKLHNWLDKQPETTHLVLLP